MTKLTVPIDPVLSKLQGENCQIRLTKISGFIAKHEKNTIHFFKSRESQIYFEINAEDILYISDTEKNLGACDIFISYDAEVIPKFIPGATIAISSMSSRSSGQYPTNPVAAQDCGCFDAFFDCKAEASIRVLAYSACLAGCNIGEPFPNPLHEA